VLKGVRGCHQIRLRKKDILSEKKSDGFSFRFRFLCWESQGCHASKEFASFYPEAASMLFRGIGKKKCDFSFLTKSISGAIDFGDTSVCRTSAQQNRRISGPAPSESA
jgi:hypothetical protein